MRRILRRFAGFLAVLMLLAGAAGMAEEDNCVYVSDFSAGADGWYPRSTGSARAAVLPEGALRIEGRSDDWHSLGRDFDLVPGGRYVLRAEVWQDQAESAVFMISVAHTRDGLETYENLARAAVPRGEWTELRGEWTAGDYQRFVLYVETLGAPALDFALRAFRVDAPEGVPAAAASAAPMVMEPAGDLPALKEIYAGMFDVGVCMSRREACDPEAAAFAASQFGIFTPENELKPEAVLDVAGSRLLAREDETAVAVHIDAARPLLDFARENGLKVHGHVLVWHSQTPEAFFHEGYDPDAPLVSREVMLGRLENYIRGVMECVEESCPGVIVSWDVLNEAIDDTTGALRASPWLRVVGEDYPARAFELARKYAPEGTLLYYNDYNTADPRKQDGIVRLLQTLMAEGNLDGYGFQMHVSAAWPSQAALESAVERIAALGLRLRVSELDVTVDDNSEASFRRQAARYAGILRLLRRYADRFEAVQMWGITDRLSWRSAQYPLLFDGNRNPKPAFWAVADPDSVE